MALIVAPAAGAESLCSVAQADTYHAARGAAAWAALTPDAKEQALRRATDYMAVYSPRWKGERTSADQPLDWPRAGVVANGYEVDDETVPVPVANACALLALKASTAELAPDLGPQKQSVSVGPISTTYASGARQTLKFQAVDNILAPYLGGGANNVMLVRA